MHIEPFIPDELRFSITRKCDGACRHCYNLSGNDIDRLSAEDFIEILKQVHELNPKLDRITLTGGEPLNEMGKVLNITRFANSLGMRVRLVTRGWELNSEVCNELKAAGVTKVQIGLDSSGEYGYVDDRQIKWDTYHSWLRGDKLGFKKTVEAIKIVINSGIEVSVRYSLCLSNSNDVVKTYQFISQLGGAKFKFRILFPDGRAKNKLVNELISGEEMAKAQYGLINSSAGNKTVVEITQPCFYKLPGRSDLSKNGHLLNAFKEDCPCGITAAYIDSNGDVKYCLFDEKILGNVCNESFLTIWNSALAGEARKQRCILDRSGTECSSFKLLYMQFGDYSSFMRDYIKVIKEKLSL